MQLYILSGRPSCACDQLFQLLRLAARSRSLRANGISRRAHPPRGGIEKSQLLVRWEARKPGYTRGRHCGPAGMRRPLNFLDARRSIATLSSGAACIRRRPDVRILKTSCGGDHVQTHIDHIAVRDCGIGSGRIVGADRDADRGAIERSWQEFIGESRLQQDLHRASRGNRR